MLKRLFYIVAAILIVIWAIGFFVYAVGAVIHLVLIIAIILIAFKVARSGKSKTSTTNDRVISKYPPKSYNSKL